MTCSTSDAGLGIPSQAGAGSPPDPDADAEPGADAAAGTGAPDRAPLADTPGSADPIVTSPELEHPASVSAMRPYRNDMDGSLNGQAIRSSSRRDFLGRTPGSWKGQPRPITKP